MASKLSILITPHAMAAISALDYLRNLIQLLLPPHQQLCLNYIIITFEVTSQRTNDFCISSNDFVAGYRFSKAYNKLLKYSFKQMKTAQHGVLS